MREIKFRAWLKKEMQMGYPSHLKVGHPEGVFEITVPFEESLRTFRKLHSIDQFDLMQFTGLHDKNGKEIYEGDVVRCFGIYDKGERISDDGLWEIYWRFDRWHLRRGEEQWDNGDYYSGDDVYWSEPDGSRKMEVIGNIYEHPELLSA